MAIEKYPAIATEISKQMKNSMDEFEKQVNEHESNNQKSLEQLFEKCKTTE